MTNLNPIRIIPRLDVKGPFVVKGIHLEGLRVIGRPQEMAKQYYLDGADELFFMDVVASLYERNSLENLIQLTAKEIFIPLTVGGGLRNLDDIGRVLNAGADKVSLNTAVIKNPQLIKDACRVFGSSTITISIEAIKRGNNYYAYTDNGREETDKEVTEWCRQVEALGAGEIFCTSIDKEGTGLGYDQNLIDQVQGATTLPIVYHGGIGNIEHATTLVKNNKIDGICIASLLHYNATQNRTNNFEVEGEGNLEFLKKNKVSKNIASCKINDIKNHLKDHGVSVRFRA